jgi:cytochrome c551/c552
MPGIRQWGVAVALAFLVAGCGEKAGEERKDESHEEEEEQLTPFQLENGLGPIKEKFELGALDPALAAKGKEVFEAKCSMCHKMDSTYVGPSLSEVTARRTPAYIMNMILNPQEMVEHHPVAKQLLAERMTFMPNQQLSQEDARAVLEYLRTQLKGTPKP